MILLRYDSLPMAIRSYDWASTCGLKWMPSGKATEAVTKFKPAQSGVRHFPSHLPEACEFMMVAIALLLRFRTQALNVSMNGATRSRWKRSDGFSWSSVELVELRVTTVLYAKHTMPLLSPASQGCVLTESSLANWTCVPSGFSKRTTFGAGQSPSKPMCMNGTETRENTKQGYHGVYCLAYPDGGE